MATPSADDSNSEIPSLEDLISLQEASELSGLSTSYLRLLVRQGDIWGVKLGRNWVTTAEAVRGFLSAERKRGPKPKKSANSTPLH